MANIPCKSMAPNLLYHRSARIISQWSLGVHNGGGDALSRPHTMDTPGNV